MKKIIAILAAVVLVAGCSERPSTAAKDPQLSPNQVAGDTDAVSGNGRCTTSDFTPITIHLKDGEISVSPYTADAKRGDELRFNVPASIEGIVHVGGKEGDDVWISANSAKGADKFYVCIDPDLAIPEGQEKKLFEYFILIPRVGYLDPEVIVRR